MGMYQPFGDILMLAVTVLFFVGGVIVTCKYREEIKNYIKKNKCDRTVVKYTFSSVWFIIFILLNLFGSIAGIEKIL